MYWLINDFERGICRNDNKLIRCRDNPILFLNNNFASLRNMANGSTEKLYTMQTMQMVRTDF